MAALRGDAASVQSALGLQQLITVSLMDTYINIHINIRIDGGADLCQSQSRKQTSVLFYQVLIRSSHGFILRLMNIIHSFIKPQMLYFTVNTTTLAGVAMTTAMRSADGRVNKTFSVYALNVSRV